MDNIEDKITPASVVANLNRMLQYKNKVLLSTLAVLLCTAVTVYLWPPTYTATTSLLPPTQNNTGIAPALSSNPFSTATTGFTTLGPRDPSGVYVDILMSGSILNLLIERFQLQELYGKKNVTEAREEFLRHIGISSNKNSVIYISVDDRDPKRAAEIANAFVEELRLKVKNTAMTEANRRRLFYEQQLLSAKEDLISAEEDIRKFTKETGLVKLDKAAESLVQSAATLKSQIADREVRLRVRLSYSTENNPEVEMLRNEIAGMKAELRKMEIKHGIASGDNSMMVNASTDYIRLYRNLKYRETLYEILSKQYEIARVDEGRDTVMIQVLDVATVPEKKSKPRRLTTTAGVTMVFFAMAVLYAYLYEFPFRQLRGDQEFMGKLEEFKKLLRFKG